MTHEIEIDRSDIEFSIVRGDGSLVQPRSIAGRRDEDVLHIALEDSPENILTNLSLLQYGTPVKAELRLVSKSEGFLHVEAYLPEGTLSKPPKGDDLLKD